MKAVVSSAGRFWLPALRRLQRHGADWEPTLARASLTVDALEDHDRRVPLAAGRQLLREGARALREPLFGLYAGLGIERASFPLIAFVATTQRTGRAAFQVASQLTPLTFDSLEFALEHAADSPHVTIRLSQAGVPCDDPLLAEYLVGSVLGVQQGAVEVVPQRVAFVHAPRAPVETYRRVLGSSVVFKQEACAITYCAPVDTRLTGADPVLSEVLSKQAFGLLAQLPVGAVHAPRVHRSVLTQLACGVVDIATTASALHMSERTLRRRLAAEGTSFREIVDGARRERALVLMERRDQNLDEVALALGFAGAGAFRRAFHRWTGESPRAYRAKLALDD